jgi:hypothetical protein
VQRRVEPDDELRPIEDEAAQLAVVAAVGDPLVPGQRFLDARSELVVGRLAPTRPPVQRVELDVRKAVQLGQAFRECRLPRTGRADDGNPACPRGATQRCRSGPSGACPSSRRRSTSTR